VSHTQLRKTPRAIGRYLLFDEIARGGMATVHLGRLVGPGGFSRTVAVKRLHGEYANDPEFVTMFLDEARLAGRIRHPNVVATLDVVAQDGELFLVMEYVQGLSLSQLLKAAEASGGVPYRVALAIGIQTLLGLHAAHEATSDRGDPLGIVHRDVSPQNVLVGLDGGVRVVDFGIAKAAARVHTTQDGRLKGKVSYMSPEQLRQHPPVDRRTDVFAASIVLWETLTSRRLFAAADAGGSIMNIMNLNPPPPSSLVPEIPAAVDAVVLRGLSKDPNGRYATAREMARALELAATPAGALEVGEWVEARAGAVLRRRDEQVAEIESVSSDVSHDAPTVADPAGKREAVSDATEGTDLSLARAASLPRPRRSGAWIIAASIVVLGAGVGAAVLWSNRTRDEQPETATPQAPASTVAPLARSSALREIPPPPPPSPTPSAAAVDAAAPRKPVAPIARKPAIDKPKPSCDPPYTLNPDGSKRFKPECF
jgi:serine/threonine-protein kinase